MSRLADTLPPVPETQLADAIAGWVRRAPPRMLVELADSGARDSAACQLAELITAEMTMAYPELVESSAPMLPF